jgi:molybdate transport system substrate-binding protein
VKAKPGAAGGRAKPRAGARPREAAGGAGRGRGDRPRRSLSLNAAVAVAVAAAVALASCGGGGDGPRLTVSAASSLNAPFTDYGRGFDGAEVRLSFAGSDQLAAQIRGGARPDVFAAASDVLMRRLAQDRLVERPVEFAYNRLVVAAPRNGEVKRFADLARPGTRIAVGSRSVPVGAYAREALERLPPRLRAHVEANVESEEPDATTVVGRVRAGAVDAAFAYRSDVRAVSELREVAIPVQVRPAYAAAVVRGTSHAAEARAFVLGLRSARAREALRRAGFELPP